ncbi:hypothetical protein GJ699_28130 [Duganella sp. FT80W]|uniref:Uncharacterized protein n=1 Tax=Duganella guangzhouensis TaxID=2666084 RepID=A0A6I2LAU4_9BURK|nr:hypothetical protein [Duganella guangzhouensis]MRW93866.1 hypothetical protein [Duganella guangzhouensis]
MIFIQIAVVLFTVVLGIPIQIIDYKHRKKKAYEPGDAWAYYSRLSKEGNPEGKFMMAATYCGIAIIVAALVLLTYRLFSM